MILRVAEKSPSVATLYGQEYLAVELPPGGEPIVGNSETLSLYFKTTQSTGLLYYAGRVLVIIIILISMLLFSMFIQ